MAEDWQSLFFGPKNRASLSTPSLNSPPTAPPVLLPPSFDAKPIPTPQKTPRAGHAQRHNTLSEKSRFYTLCASQEAVKGSNARGSTGAHCKGVPHANAGKRDVGLPRQAWPPL
jgi:hypothetical protein